MTVPFPVRVVPSLTFRAWLTPPPLRPSTTARDAHEVRDLTPVFFGGVPGYEIGTGPVVVAAHGWGGRPAQMTAIARRFADEGYRVIIPQLPGRAGGPATDIKKVAAALRNVIDDVGWPVALVAHSFAAMVLRLAFRDESPRYVALVAPALDVRDALGVFGDRLQLYSWARRGLRNRLQRWDPSLWPTMSTLLPSQLPGAQILIVHDPDDSDTPFTRSAELAAIRPNTEILPVGGPGHSRILSHDLALDAIASFVDPATVTRHNVA